MFLGDFGLCLVVLPDQRTILATAKAIYVFLRGLGHWWEVLHGGRAILATA